MNVLVLRSSPLPLGESDHTNLLGAPSPLSRTSFAATKVLLPYIVAIFAMLWGIQPLQGQTVFDALPEDTNSIMLPYALDYNNQLIRQSGVRYGLWATHSPYLLEENIVVFDIYEKIPAAIKLVPELSVMPIWGFRYWPEEGLYTWVSVLNGVNTAYICNRQLEKIDSLPISDPHEFYVMPDGLGYAYLGSSIQSGNIDAPALIWLNTQHDTVAYWKATDPTFGISYLNYTFSTCTYTTHDTVDGMVDYFHPNSIAAIKTDGNTLKVGLYNRNVDVEVELTFAQDTTGWHLVAIRDNEKDNDALHTDDVSWFNTGHDLQYLYANGDTLVKSAWDNGGCRLNPATGLRLFTQTSNDTLTLLRAALYGNISQSTAMGNGGVLLPRRYANSIQEINSAPVYGNTGADHPSLPIDTVRHLLGTWLNDDLVFGIKQKYFFSTYRFYPYLQSQLDLDDLRPELHIQFSSDSTLVTLSIDSTLYTDILWIDGLGDVWSRTLTVQEFFQKELLAYVTNDPSWFWFATHRYKAEKHTVGLPTELLDDRVLNIYPNPVKAGSKVNLTTTGQTMLTDLTGKVVAKCDACNQLIVPEHLPAGAYLVLIRGEQGFAKRSKLVVY